ncbi:DUF4214 domain-containing protein [Methylobacterium sp. WL103]|nr:DUF4214 domain-containing protein [Methylobacterium sp. WL103]
MSGANVLNLGGTITGNLAIQTGMLQVNAADGGSTLANVITGAGGLIQSSANALTLTAENTYTGATTINGGTLQAGAANVIAALSALVLNSGTFDLNDFNQSVGSINGETGIINLGSKTLTFGTLGGSTSYGGAITGTGGITMIGGAKQFLGGDNTYTSITRITSGTLNITSSTALGTAEGGTVVQAGSVLEVQNDITVMGEALTLSGDGGGGGALRSIYGNNTLTGTITLAADTRINSDEDTLRLTGGISGDGALRNLTLGGTGNGLVSGAIAGNLNALTKDGAGTWILSGANTYTGATTIAGGTLNIQNGSALGTADAGTVVGNGAALQLQGGITVVSETLTLAGAGLGKGALQNVSQDNTYGGVITLLDNSVIASADGTLTLTNAVTNKGDGNLNLSGAGNGVVSGPLTLTNGFLAKSDGGIWTLSGANTVNGVQIEAGTLRVTNSAALGAGEVEVFSPTALGTLNIDGSQAPVMITNLIKLNNAGVGGLGALTGSGTASVTGNVVLDSNATIGTTALTDSLTISGQVQGGDNATLTKVGAGTLTLTGANTYTGGTTVTAGTLRVQNDLALGTTTAGTTVANGATLQISGSRIAEALTLSGTGVSNGGALQLEGSDSTVSGAITLAADSRINVGVASNGTLAGPIDAVPTGAALTLGGTGIGNVSGNIAASVSSLTIDAADTWVLRGINSYTGATTISSGRLLLWENGSISTSSGVAIATGATFDISIHTGGVSIKSLASSAMDQTGAVTLGDNALTLTAATGTFSGTITGTATSNLTLQSGTEILANANTGFAGAVNLTAGTLALNHATTVGGTTTIDAAGSGAITFAAGAQTLRLDTAGTLANTIASFAVSDTIDLRAINFTGAQLSVNGTTVTVTETTGGNDVNVLTINAAAPGYQYALVNDGADFAALQLQAIPPAPPQPPAPSGPTAVADTGSTVIGTAVTKAAAMGVLVNDSGAGGTLAVTAVNGQTAAVGKAVAGAYGNLTLNADGSYSYAPDPAKAVFTGSVVDHFTYTDTANGQTATTTLDITVAPPAASVLSLFGTVVTNAATQTGSVYALYEGLLGRAPDALGLEGFSASIQAGSNLTSVAQALLGSPEHGPAISDPTAYVQSLYTNVLHRSADGGGLTYFTNELNAGVSQATVAVQIATSTEAQNVNAKAFSTGVFVPDAIDAAVAREYYAVLGRTPDATGLQSFEFQVKQAAVSGGANGAIQALGNVANAMLNSSEYASTHMGLSDAGFVDSLYVGALGRHADAGGAAFFADQLAHGISKAAVALEISQSFEAQVHLVGQIENGFHLIG